MVEYWVVSMAVPMAAWSVPLSAGSKAESLVGQTAELKADSMVVYSAVYLVYSKAASMAAPMAAS